MKYGLQVCLTESLLVSGDKVLLQSAIISINGQTLIKAWVLLNSASWRTFMTNNLAEQLKLYAQHREHLSVSMFWAENTLNYIIIIIMMMMKGNHSNIHEAVQAHVILV